MVKFIAEISSNYVGTDGHPSMDRAIRLIEAAKRSGANAVKFQHFKGDLLYNKSILPNIASYLSGIEIGKSDLLKLKKASDDLDIEFMCSVFHPDDVPFVNSIVDIHKIASWELFSEPHINPLFPAIAKTGKKVIVSTAGAKLDEVDYCLDVLVENGLPLENITIMHCDPGYPVLPEEVQLKRILDLGMEFFPCTIGYSAHFVNPVVVASSVLYEAKVIEVHFDLEDKEGVESGHSYTPNQFSSLVKTVSMLETCKNGEPRNPQGEINKYRKNPSDWMRPLKRD